jgi:hypothetical protein
LFGAAEQAFCNFGDTESVYPAHLPGKTDANAPVRSPAPRGGKRMTMENDMTGKITAILAAAVVLASASVASARTVHAPYANPYYNQDTSNLRYGHANDPQFDPYRGTVFEGVAPY